MELALESVLKQRTLQLEGRIHRRRSVVLSAMLHFVLFAILILVPILTHQQPEPIEFTPVTIVPVQALGVENPVAPAPRQEAPPKVAPKPSPPVEEATPEKKASKKPVPSALAQETSSQSGSTRPEALGQRVGSATGSSLGTSALGASVGGLDNPDFVYGYYVDQMLAMIGSQWQRPPLGAEIEAIIHFRIHQDGHISDVRVVQSSGYNSYDLAGLRAIQLAAPFPRLPQSYRHNSLGVNLKLR